METEKFEDLTTLTFEGREFPAVRAWDEYLTNCYGADYMTPKSNHNFQPHHVWGDVWVEE